MATTKIKLNKSKDDKDKKDKKVSNPHVLGARITEKSAIGADKGIYTFNVATTTNKNEIKKAIKLMYNVTPTKIAIIQVRRKVIMRRGVIGIKQGGKKAVVHLKKGDKIAFV